MRHSPKLSLIGAALALLSGGLSSGCAAVPVSRADVPTIIYDQAIVVARELGVKPIDAYFLPPATSTLAVSAAATSTLAISSLPATSTLALPRLARGAIASSTLALAFPPATSSLALSSLPATPTLTLTPEGLKSYRSCAQALDRATNALDAIHANGGLAHLAYSELQHVIEAPVPAGFDAARVPLESKALDFLADRLYDTSFGAGPRNPSGLDLGAHTAGLRAYVDFVRQYSTNQQTKDAAAAVATRLDTFIASARRARGSLNNAIVDLQVSGDYKPADFRNLVQTYNALELVLNDVSPIEHGRAVVQSLSAHDDALAAVASADYRFDLRDGTRQAREAISRTRDAGQITPDQERYGLLFLDYQEALGAGSIKPDSETLGVSASALVPLLNLYTEFNKPFGGNNVLHGTPEEIANMKVLVYRGQAEPLKPENHDNIVGVYVAIGSNMLYFAVPEAIIFGLGGDGDDGSKLKPEIINPPNNHTK